MSKAADILRAVRTAVKTGTSPQFITAGDIKKLDEMIQYEVLLLPDKAQRSPAGSGFQRWTMDVLVMVREERVAETDSLTFAEQILDTTWTLLDRIAAALLPGGISNFEMPLRSEVQFIWKARSNVCGAIFILGLQWKQRAG